MIEILANFLRSVIILSPSDMLQCVYLCLNKVSSCCFDLSATLFCQGRARIWRPGAGHWREPAAESHRSGHWKVNGQGQDAASRLRWPWPRGWSQSKHAANHVSAAAAHRSVRLCSPQGNCHYDRSFGGWRHHKMAATSLLCAGRCKARKSTKSRACLWRVAKWRLAFSFGLSAASCASDWPKPRFWLLLATRRGSPHHPTVRTGLFQWRNQL